MLFSDRLQGELVLEAVDGDELELVDSDVRSKSMRIPFGAVPPVGSPLRL